HGQRQGQPGIFRVRDPARQDPLRDGRRDRGAGQGSLRPCGRQAAVQDHRGAEDARTMKPSELRGKSGEELQKELEGLLKAQFGLRMQLATQQLGNTSQMKKVKRDIARVHTIMRENAPKQESAPEKPSAPKK